MTYPPQAPGATEVGAASAPDKLDEVSLLVTERETRLYAEITNDYNPIHLDPEFAAKTPMGGVIAHGTMSLNLIWYALMRSLGADAAGLLEIDVKFIRPVRLGDVVTAGGSRSGDVAGAFDVWVRRQTGETVILGTARPL